MKNIIIFATVAIFLFGLACGAPQADLITSLPGQPSGGFNFKQYSGYLDAKTNGVKAHYHYWFVESQGNPSKDPVILWLNGGPGCSSLNGLIEENGPFSVNQDLTLKVNPFSWNKLANIVYLESPAGVGFSYSDGDFVSYDDSKTASENYQALSAWFTKFPEYSKNPLYLMGESYAGHYVPELASLIVQATVKNPNVPPQSNFRGFATGNPLTDQVYDLGGKWLNAYLQAHGLIQMDDASSTNADGNYNPYDILVDVCPDSSLSLKDYIRFPHPMNKMKGIRPNVTVTANGKRYVHNPPACADTWTSNYLNQASVQTAIHVQPTNWAVCGGPSYSFSQQSMIPIYKQFAKSNKYKVLVYSGDEDTVLNFLATERWLLDLKLGVSKSWSAWTYDQGFGTQVGGYWIHFNGGTSFRFMTVKGAGHMVPWFQPAQAYQLLQHFLSQP
eukprot:TRINITY_DN1688_c0_g1_i1.p1 TRINITY_DN1688_c0_g1~~TRINITY_DN1688_c0_g1_i1.p1  ORF type:complete len:444 (-),score=122.58 TRINITY_DN1688_c0_g1_i1:70-1401(-)